MIEITLNKADIVEVLKTLETFNIDHFKLIRHGESGIGYCIDVEYNTKMNDKMVDIRIPVCGVEDW